MLRSVFFYSSCVMEHGSTPSSLGKMAYFQLLEYLFSSISKYRLKLCGNVCCLRRSLSNKNFQNRISEAVYRHGCWNMGSFLAPLPGLCFSFIGFHKKFISLQHPFYSISFSCLNQFCKNFPNYATVLLESLHQLKYTNTLSQKRSAYRKERIWVLSPWSVILN